MTMSTAVTVTSHGAGSALVIDTKAAAATSKLGAVEGGPRSAGGSSIRSLSARVYALCKLDNLIGSWQRSRRRISRSISLRTTNSRRKSSTASSTSAPSTPGVQLPSPLTPATPGSPETPGSGAWLASTDVERAAFFMYLEQVQCQLKVLETAVEQLEAHIIKVSGGLQVLETVPRGEIRRRLMGGEWRGEDAVVREWLRDLDREVAEDMDGDEIGGKEWKQRVQWEKNSFRESVVKGFEWARERLQRVGNGVRAAEVKLGRLVERGVVEDVLFPRVAGPNHGAGQKSSIFMDGEDELGGRGARATVVESRAEVEGLANWISTLQSRYLLSEGGAYIGDSYPT